MMTFTEHDVDETLKCKNILSNQLEQNQNQSHFSVIVVVRVAAVILVPILTSRRINCQVPEETRHDLTRNG